MGSHLDTQINGGRFDGIAGVLGGLEVCRTLDALGHRTRRPIEIVNWTNEEGARFSPPMVGSGCFVGAYTLDWAQGRADEEGRTIGEELERIGYRGEMEAAPARLRRLFRVPYRAGLRSSTATACRSASSPAASRARACSSSSRARPPIPAPGRWSGAATRFWPARGCWSRSTISAGTYAAGGGKATAARLAAWPNKPGILSDWAQAVCDVRHPDPETSEVMAERMRRAVGESAARAGCTAEILDVWKWGGKHLRAGADRQRPRRPRCALGYRTQDILSQAGHDAYFVARHAPDDDDLRALQGRHHPQQCRALHDARIWSPASTCCCTPSWHGRINDENLGSSPSSLI